MQLRLAIAISCAACGSGNPGGGGGSDVDGGAPHDTANPPGFTQLIASNWTLPIGGETYFCAARTLTEDMYITGFHTTAPPGTHHTALSIGVPRGPDGTGPCDATDNFETIIFGAGVGTPDLALPDGLAVHVRAGQQLLLNLHVFNATDAPLSGVSGVAVATSAVPVAEAGIGNTGKTTDLVVPPGPSTQVGTCTVPSRASAFSAFPHMHKLGVHMRAIATTASGDHTLIDTAYSFEDQRYYTVAPRIELAKGDTIRVECSYQNNTNMTVHFGQSSLQEMCGLGIYLTPPWSQPACSF